MAEKINIHEQVTASIIASLEAGTPAWRKPWTGDRGGAPFPLRSNGTPYSGINVLMLWIAADTHGYRASHWFTYRQAQELGGQVRKGEKASTVVKYGTVDREQSDEQGGTEKRAIPYLRAYKVFNAEQIDGLPDRFAPAPVDEVQNLGTQANPVLDAFFAATGADIRTSTDPWAYYNTQIDFIHMPPIASFHDAAGYYATLAHEATHWTGHATRLDRFARFQDRTAYAFEELVAEIGNCMLCARLGLVPDFGQSGAYIKGWLRALQDDKRLIFKAATEAQKAVELLIGSWDDKKKANLAA